LRITLKFHPQSAEETKAVDSGRESQPAGERHGGPIEEHPDRRNTYVVNRDESLE